MDDLDRFVAAQAERDPGFLSAYEAALERRLLATHIARRREAKGFSQKSLAEAVGSTQAVISRFETGGDFRFSTLQKVSHALGFESVAEALADQAADGAGSGGATVATKVTKRATRKRAAKRATRKKAAKKI